MRAVSQGRAPGSTCQVVDAVVFRLLLSFGLVRRGSLLGPFVVVIVVVAAVPACGPACGRAVVEADCCVETRACHQSRRTWTGQEEKGKRVGRGGSLIQRGMVRSMCPRRPTATIIHHPDQTML